ncbi:MAG TPA: dihydroorotase [Firmicutes bacterium]|nr:dihydroorotase [Bacillota bacterium]
MPDRTNPQNRRLLIRGALVIDPSQNSEELRDLLVAGGRIAALADETDLDGAEVIEAEGLVCAPGLVDMHVHLRDPGQTYKEDLESGCRAAAAGGVTSLACMPNTSPALDNPAVIGDIVRRAASAGAHVYPVAAVTAALAGEKLNDFAALKKAGAVAVSDDGRPVPAAGQMMDAMRAAAALSLPVLSHCEDLTLTRGGIMNDGAVSRELGVPGIHRAAEEAATAREIALAAATGLPVHICHVSTRGSVALLRDARRRGVPVTGETAPHYFTFTEEALRSRDADFRMNPPLRTEDDREAVIEGLCDGTLGAIATDHAPHSPAEKADFLRAPNGSIGMETSLAAGITALVATGRLSLRRLLWLMSTGPARLLGIPAGTLQEGAAADIVLFDPAEEWTVDPARLHGKSRNTPFKGMTLRGRVRYTLLDGRVVYRAE